MVGCDKSPAFLHRCNGNAISAAKQTVDQGRNKGEEALPVTTL
jgi:hypothetical protein